MLEPRLNRAKPQTVDCLADPSYTHQDVLKRCVSLDWAMINARLVLKRASIQIQTSISDLEGHSKPILSSSHVLDDQNNSRVGSDADMVA
jgi:hypothetical protein